MNTRELALELAQLKPAQRQQLLLELPEAKREQLLPLIDELRSLVDARGGAQAFEQVLADMRDEAEPRPHNCFDEAVLSHLLQHESIALKRQLMDVFVAGQHELMTERVHTALAAWLQARLRDSPFVAPEPVSEKTWWKRLRHG